MARKRGFSNIEKTYTQLRLNVDELQLVLEELGLERIRKINGRKGVNFQFCCPFHGERRPSAGLLIDDSGSMYGQCYTCKETFGLPKLFAHTRQIEIRDAIDELEERFRSEKVSTIYNSGNLKTYEDVEEESHSGKKRRELKKSELAPYRSGKETHQYYFDRGFDDDDVAMFKIGWDRTRKRITIPLFHADGVLAGFSGRAVLDNKLPNGKLSKKYKKYYGEEPKYYLYDHVPIGELLYLSHLFPKGETDTAILVEGLLDAQWFHKQGFPNTMATIIAKMTVLRGGDCPQKDILHSLGVKKVILFLDDDEAGKVGEELANKILKDDFVVLKAKYPTGYKDVLGDDEHSPMTAKQLKRAIDKAERFGKKKLVRYE